METVTHQEFKQRLGESIIILILVLIVGLIKSFKLGFSHEYIAILSATVICLISLIRLIFIEEKYIETGDSSGSRKYFLETAIIFILGILSFYLFFVKGVYGIILLFSKFSFKILIQKLLIIILSYRLVYCTSKIQTVFKFLKSKK